MTETSTAPMTSQAEPPRLYTVAQITLATVLGTFVGAGWCARANFVALGKPRQGNVALGVGVALTLALMAAAFVLPAWVPGPALLLPQIVVAATWAQTIFGNDLERNATRSAGSAALV